MPRCEINGVEMWTINEVSEKTGLSTSQIRNYTTAGLISSVKTQCGKLQYQWFDDIAISRIYIIKAFRDLGMSLKEIEATLTEENVDEKTLLDQLIRRLKEQRAEASRRILYCKLAKFMGLKFMLTAIGRNENIDSIVKRWQKPAGKQFGGYTDDEKHRELISGLIEKLKEYKRVSLYPPMSDEGQRYFDKLITDCECLACEHLLGRSTLSDLGVRFLSILVILFYCVFGGGESVKIIEQNVGTGALDYITHAAIYSGLKTLDDVFTLLRKEYSTRAGEMSENDIAMDIRQRLHTWFEGFYPIPDLEMDESILDCISDLFDLDDGDLCNPDLANELCKYLQGEAEKLPFNAK